VAVASAGPYASLHFAPDRQPCQYPTTLFLQAGCPSCRPTNSVKALKANALKTGSKLNIIISRKLASVCLYGKKAAALKPENINILSTHHKHRSQPPHLYSSHIYTSSLAELAISSRYV